jgi:hypothetical protein
MAHPSHGHPNDNLLLPPEYMAAFQGAKEAVYLRQLLLDLGHPQEGPTTVWCDNLGAKTIAENPKHHNRTKHFDVQFHYIRELVESKFVSIQYIPTSDQVADIFTKAAPESVFAKHVNKLLK